MVCALGMIIRTVATTASTATAITDLTQRSHTEPQVRDIQHMLLPQKSPFLMNKLPLRQPRQVDCGRTNKEKCVGLRTTNFARTRKRSLLVYSGSAKRFAIYPPMLALLFKQTFRNLELFQSSFEGADYMSRLARTGRILNALSLRVVCRYAPEPKEKGAKGKASKIPGEEERGPPGFFGMALVDVAPLL